MAGKMKDTVERAPHWSWVELGPDQYGDAQLVPSRIRWTRSKPESPMVAAVFEIHEQRLVCVSITLEGSSGSPVSMDAVRGLGLDTIAREAFASMAIRERIDFEEVDGGIDFVTKREALSAIEARRAMNAPKSRRGRPPADRSEIEHVARIYRECIDGKPVQAICVVLGLTERTAGRRLKQAEDLGLLPPTTPGKKRGV